MKMIKNIMIYSANGLFKYDKNLMTAFDNIKSGKLKLVDINLMVSLRSVKLDSTSNFGHMTYSMCTQSVILVTIVLH